MSKTAIITDIHFCVRNSSLYYIERYRLFFDNIFFPYLKEHNIKRVLLLGDTFEDRKSVNVLGLDSCRTMFFDVLRDNNIEVISILGNHDVFYRNTNELTSMDIIDNEYSNVHLVREYEDFKFGNKTFGLMSWVNTENLDRNLARIKSAQTDYLLGHYEIINFEMTKGNFADKGFEPSIFKGYKKVLSGHFHIPSSIDNISYIGNSFQTSWDDYNSDRGFTVYDEITDQFEFVKNTYNNFDVIIYTDDVIVDQFDFDKYNNVKVRILVTQISDLNQSSYRQFIDTLNKHVFEYSVVEVKTESLSDTSSIIIAMKSNMEMINDYVNVLYIDEDDKKSVNKIMYELYNEALSQSTN